jgi:hypothetical protein
VETTVKFSELPANVQKMTPKNARISGYTLGNNDHGVLSSHVFLDYGGSCQGFGGYILGLDPNQPRKNPQPEYAAKFIWRVLDIAGVYDWRRIENCPVRAVGTSSKIHAIGHFTTDEWFCPEVEWAEEV